MSEPPPPVLSDDLFDDASDEKIDLEIDKTDSAQTDIDLDLASTPEATPEKKELNDDMFFSTMSEPHEVESKSKQAEDMDEIFKTNNTNTEIKLTDDEDDAGDNGDNEDTSVPAASATTPKPNINISMEPKAKTFEAPTNNSLAKESRLSNFYNDTEEQEEEEDAEERDKFLEVTLSDPMKKGDGMSSYMVYKLTTKTNMPVFRSQEFTAQRRFSDFLNLYEKLKEKHLQAGRLLPPAPEKDMLGMAKVKMSNKEDSTPNEFIERRRAALERFLNRLAKGKAFKYDPDFRDFLETADDLPKATNTSALSLGGMSKMFRNVTDSVSKIAIKMDETDQWFDDKSRQVENLYLQFKKLYNMIELMYGWRKDLSVSTKDFSKSIAILANSEEQLSLSRSLSQLGEIYEKIDQIYLDQSQSDYFVFGELVRDYVSLFDNIKEVLHQRVKMYSSWQKLEDALKSKRESKAKLEASNKLDKVPTVAAEIKDLETKCEKSKEDFESISKNIKEEMKRFDFSRIKEFKSELTKYLQTLLNNQEQLVKIWEAYLPQVKAI
jgi:sorting nexin-1/2